MFTGTPINARNRGPQRAYGRPPAQPSLPLRYQPNDVNGDFIRMNAAANDRFGEISLSSSGSELSPPPAHNGSLSELSSRYEEDARGSIEMTPPPANGYDDLRVPILPAHEFGEEEEDNNIDEYEAEYSDIVNGQAYEPAVSSPQELKEMVDSLQPLNILRQRKREQWKQRQRPPTPKPVADELEEDIRYGDDEKENGSAVSNIASRLRQKMDEKMQERQQNRHRVEDSGTADKASERWVESGVHGENILSSSPPPPPTPPRALSQSRSPNSSMSNSSLSIANNSTIREIGNKGIERSVLRISNRAEQPAKEQDEEDDDGGFLATHLVDPVTRFLTRSFKIGLKTAHFLVGPLLNKRLWWVLPLLVFSMIATVLVAYGIFSMAAMALSGSSPFHAPPAIPNDLGELVTRLMAVEQELASVSQLSNNLNSGFHDSSRQSFDLFAKLEGELAEASRGIRDLSRQLASLSGDVADNSDSSDKLAKDLKALQESLHHIQAAISNSSEDYEDLKKSVTDGAEDNAGILKQIEASIEELRNRMSILERAEKGEQSALRLLDEYLPSRLAVSMDPKTHEIQVQPEFWKFLESFVNKHFDSSLDTLPLPEFDWDEFKRNNEKVIEDMVKKHASNDNSAAFVSKDDFKNILAEKLGEQRHDVARKLERLERKIELYNATDEKNSEQYANAPTQLALENLINEQLAKYQAKTSVNKPDYANILSGAKVDYTHTSRTYIPHSDKPLLYRAMRSIVSAAGFGRVAVNQPDVALRERTSVGNCWPLQGSRGTLGILLAEETVVTDLAIEHVPAKLTLNPSSAPRTVSLWGYVENQKEFSRLRDLGLDILESNGMSNYVKLVSGTYDVYTNTAVQLFPVTLAIRHLNIRTDRVVLLVEDNWGSNQFTCLYRVQVFGEKTGGRPSLVLQQPSLTPDLPHDASFGDDTEL
ncbi:hypothetical protein TRVA0_006S02300 [Trichomonascus vanleenenianus]|uniref:uncharacterized protein n=1 Tax=Trichomonascus vanleenenianus TaxID=2268995 RepID=UPI003ECAFC43